MIVDDLQPINMVSFTFDHGANANDIAQICQHRIRSQYGARGAFPRVNDILRCDWTPIMEFCILPQMERVHSTVRADVPAFCQIGREIQLRVKRDQTAKDAFIAAADGCSGIGRPRIGRFTARQNQSLIKRNINLQSRRIVLHGCAKSKCKHQNKKNTST